MEAMFLPLLRWEQGIVTPIYAGVKAFQGEGAASLF